ncbi:MFS transporter [Streptomyces roseoviridis]|uniref:MFS transporter n=1 Tax=Streptomyces roseoviridis TaxID=67361 RepID=A0ABV5QXA0_9ACTN
MKGTTLRRPLTLACSVVGAAVVALDGTVLTIAQPALQHDLGADTGQVQWTSTGYLVAVASLLVFGGRLGDRYGHRRLFAVGCLAFAAASAGIAAAPGIGWVIALRVAQGAAGALLQPATLGMLRHAFPPERLAMPVALRTSAIGLAAVAGPLIGGVLVDAYGWRAVFLIGVPPTLAIALLCLAAPAAGEEGEEREHGPAPVRTPGAPPVPGAVPPPTATAVSGPASRPAPSTATAVTGPAAPTSPTAVTATATATPTPTASEPARTRPAIPPQPLPPVTVTEPAHETAHGRVHGTAHGSVHGTAHDTAAVDTNGAAVMGRPRTPAPAHSGTPTRPGAAAALDLPGACLLGLALACLVQGLAHGAVAGVVPALVAAAVAAVAFVRHERRAARPLVPMEMLRPGPVVAGLGALVAASAALSGTLFTATYLFQGTLGLDALATAQRMVPLALLIVVGAPVSALLKGRIGARRTAAGGAALLAAGVLLLAWPAVTASGPATGACAGLVGAGFGAVMVTATSVVVHRAAEEHAGVAGGLQQTAMNTGPVLGVALATLLLPYGTALPALAAVAALAVPAALGLPGPPRDTDTPARP